MAVSSIKSQHSLSGRLFDYLENKDYQLKKKNEIGHWDYKGKLIMELCVCAILALVEFIIRASLFLIQKAICYKCPNSKRDDYCYNGVAESAKTIGKSLSDIPSILRRGHMPH